MTTKIKLKISARLIRKKIRRMPSLKKRSCRFCMDKESLTTIDYKNATFLKGFLTERGKILGSRIAGTCAKHQRALSKEIRKSRVMALIPYVAQYS